MATEQLYKESQYFTTTLNVGGGINNSQTTGIIVASVSGIDDINEPGIALLSYADPLLTANAEWVPYTSINGSNELQGVTRGGEGFSAKSHANGVTVAFPHSKSHINNLVNSLRTGWVGSKYTPTYVSASSISVASTDVTAIFSKGMKIRFKQGGAYKYFVVSSSSFSTNTTINVVGDSPSTTVANSTITDFYYSRQNTPESFTSPFSYTPTIGATSGSITTSSASGIFFVTGNKVELQVVITVTTNGTGSGGLTFSLPFTASQRGVLVGRADSVSGKQLQAVFSVSGTTATVFDYSNAYPASSGETLIINGTMFI